MSSNEHSILIRAATVVDAEELARLGADTFIATFGHLYTAQDLAAFIAESRSTARYAALLRDARVRVLLAVTAAGRAIGYVLVGSCKLPITDLEERAGEVRELYVLADFQKHRLGSRLMTVALEWLDAQQRSPLYVGVWSENEGAQ